jgi:hypothetical protein
MPVTKGSFGRYVPSTGHVIFLRQGSLFAGRFDLDRLEFATEPVPVLTIDSFFPVCPWELYERLFFELLEKCRQISPKKKFRFRNKLISLDSTVIELCASMFDWARWRHTKGAVKLHLLLDHDGCLPVFAHVTEGKTADVKVAQTLDLPKGTIVAMDRGYNDYRMYARWTKAGVFFVTRIKANAHVLPVEYRPVPKGGNVLRDQTICLKPFEAGRPDLPVVLDGRSQFLRRQPERPHAGSR